MGSCDKSRNRKGLDLTTLLQLYQFVDEVIE